MKSQGRISPSCSASPLWENSFPLFLGKLILYATSWHLGQQPLNLMISHSKGPFSGLASVQDGLSKPGCSDVGTLASCLSAPAVFWLGSFSGSFAFVKRRKWDSQYMGMLGHSHPLLLVGTQ